MTLLLVDDSAVIRDRLSAMLVELDGVRQVIQASTAAEGLELSNRLAPQLVILDLRMPGGNGLSVLQALKQRKPPPTVVVLTNYPYHGFRRRSLELGADYFLNKSTEFSQVEQVVRDLCLTEGAPWTAA